MHCQSFPAVANPNTTTLILGSMPGVASLSAGQYYAHPRNLFWPIMGKICGAAPDLPYEIRLARLHAAGIGLWDVLASCERSGSLDSAINNEHPNNFVAFFTKHPHIRRIGFNGAKAETAFRRHVLKGHGTITCTMQRLPSTSPAHAGRSFAEKLADWQAFLQP